MASVSLKRPSGGRDSLSMRVGIGPLQASGDGAAVLSIGAEFVEDSDAVCLRCGFDELCEDSLEERFVIDDVESESVVGSVDGFDEQA